MGSGGCDDQDVASHDLPEYVPTVYKKCLSVISGGSLLDQTLRLSCELV